MERCISKPVLPAPDLSDNYEHSFVSLIKRTSNENNTAFSIIPCLCTQHSRPRLANRPTCCLSLIPIINFRIWCQRRHSIIFELPFPSMVMFCGVIISNLLFCLYLPQCVFHNKKKSKLCLYLLFFFLNLLLEKICFWFCVS